MLKFEWDTAKSDENETKRGLPFKVAVALFASNTYEWDDRRFFHEERRITVIGRVQGVFLVRAYTWRGTPETPVRRIISLRRAKKGEADVYRTVFEQ
jgi:uncharacterized DUF497 family protein